MPRLIPPTQFPPPHPSDPEPVGWALCTAAALWKSGRYADAVGWVQKAASNAAVLEGPNADSNVRVVELTIAATELAHYVREWSAGQDLDPASIPVSTDFQVVDLEVESVHDPTPPMTPLPEAPKGLPIKLAPRRRATTLHEDLRDAPKPRIIPVAPPLPMSAPRVLMKGKRAAGLSKTLQEGTPLPSILTRQPLPGAATPDIVLLDAHGPPSRPLRLDFEGSLITPAPAQEPLPDDAPNTIVQGVPPQRPADKKVEATPSSQAATVVAPDIAAKGTPRPKLDLGPPPRKRKR